MAFWGSLELSAKCQLGQRAERPWGVLLPRRRRERLCSVKSRYQRYQAGWKTRSGVAASS